MTDTSKNKNTFSHHITIVNSQSPSTELVSAVSSETMVNEITPSESVEPQSSSSSFFFGIGYTCKKPKLKCPNEKVFLQWLELGIAFTAGTLLAELATRMPISLTNDSSKLAWNETDIQRLILVESLIFILFNASFDAMFYAKKLKSNARRFIPAFFSLTIIAVFALLRSSVENLFQQPFINSSTFASVLLGLQTVLVGLLYFSVSSAIQGLASKIKPVILYCKKILSSNKVGNSGAIEHQTSSNTLVNENSVNTETFYSHMSYANSYIGIFYVLASIPFWLASGLDSISDGWTRSKEICWWIAVVFLVLLNGIISPLTHLVYRRKEARRLVQQNQTLADNFLETTGNLQSVFDLRKVTLLLSCIVLAALVNTLPSQTGFYSSPLLYMVLAVVYFSLTFIALIGHQNKYGSNRRYMSGLFSFGLCVGLSFAAVGFSEICLGSLEWSATNVSSLAASSPSSISTSSAPSVFQPFASQIAHALSLQAGTESSPPDLSINQIMYGPWFAPLLSVAYGDASGPVSNLKLGTLIIMASLLILGIWNMRRLKLATCIFSVSVFVCAVVLLGVINLDVSAIVVTAISTGFMALECLCQL